MRDERHAGAARGRLSRSLGPLVLGLLSGCVGDFRRPSFGKDAGPSGAEAMVTLPAASSTAAERMDSEQQPGTATPADAAAPGVGEQPEEGAPVPSAVEGPPGVNPEVGEPKPSAVEGTPGAQAQEGVPDADIGRGPPKVNEEMPGRNDAGDASGPKGVGGASPGKTSDAGTSPNAEQSPPDEPAPVDSPPDASAPLVLGSRCDSAQQCTSGFCSEVGSCEPPGSSPLCRLEACGDHATCVAGACQCQDGWKRCEQSSGCVPEDSCCSDAECPSGGSCDEGACSCPGGTHLCGNACVSDSSIDSCGSSCSACPAPSGGTAVCDGARCGGECPSGTQLCSGECIAENVACDGACPAGQRNCNDLCVELDTPSACGASCQTCPAPAHAAATCASGNCGFVCDSGHQRCGDECIPLSSCCGDDQCSGELLCLDGACGCPSGEQRCGESICVPQNGCCSDDACGSGLGCVEHRCVDTEPPSLLSVSPENGASGVTADTAIKLTYSEPMDKDSVAQALSTSGLSATSLSWNGAGTVLTITNNGGLPYASGTSTGSTDALQISVSVSGSAEDLAGNRMSAASFSFSTLRRISETLPSSAVVSYSTYAPAVGGEPNIDCSGVVTTIRAGTWLGKISGGTFLGYIQFDLSGLADSIVLLESAVMSGLQLAPEGAFYSGGRVQLKHLQSGPLDSTLLDRAAVHNWGTFVSSGATQNPRKDVWASISSQREAGSTGTQLFELSPSGNEIDTIAHFSCNGWELAVTYLLP